MTDTAEAQNEVETTGITSPEQVIEIPKRDVSQLSTQALTAAFTENSRLMQQAEKGHVNLTLSDIQLLTRQQADIMHRLNHAPAKAKPARATKGAKTRQTSAAVQTVTAGDDLSDL